MTQKIDYAVDSQLSDTNARKMKNGYLKWMENDLIYSENYCEINYYSQGKVDYFTLEIGCNIKN